MTLVELLVVLVLVGLVAGVAGVAFRAWTPVPPTSDAVVAIARARAEALATGSPVTVALRSGGHVAAATALPDGSVVADPEFDGAAGDGPAIDRLTGRAPRESR